MVLEAAVRQPKQETVPLTYHERLVHELGIKSEDIRHIRSLFEAYCEDGQLVLSNEIMILRAIRSFLKEQKPIIKEQLSHSLLGQSGCFGFSIRTCVLAHAYGVNTYIARSTNPRRMLHTLVVREDGTPFDLTEATKGGVAPMTWLHIKGYASMVQPVVHATDSWRKKSKKKKALGA